MLLVLEEPGLGVEGMRRAATVMGRRDGAFSELIQWTGFQAVEAPFRPPPAATGQPVAFWPNGLCFYEKQNVGGGAVGPKQGLCRLGWELCLNSQAWCTVGSRLSELRELRGLFALWSLGPM